MYKDYEPGSKSKLVYRTPVSPTISGKPLCEGFAYSNVGGVLAWPVLRRLVLTPLYLEIWHVKHDKLKKAYPIRSIAGVFVEPNDPRCFTLTTLKEKKLVKTCKQYVWHTSDNSAARHWVNCIMFLLGNDEAKTPPQMARPRTGSVDASHKHHKQNTIPSRQTRARGRTSSDVSTHNSRVRVGSCQLTPPTRQRRASTPLVESALNPRQAASASSVWPTFVASNGATENQQAGTPFGRIESNCNNQDNREACDAFDEWVASVRSH
ncbi:hypothetical protein QOT17_016664 [Balamuthia mandrillaris]